MVASGNGAQQHRGHVRLVARQLQVFDEPVFAVGARGAVEDEPVVRDVRLERVVDRVERVGERLQAVEERLRELAVALPVVVGAGLKLRDVGRDERGLVPHAGLQLEQVIELREGHLPVDRVRAERLRVRGGEVVRDEFGQVREVGPGDAREQFPPVLPRQVLRREPLQRVLLEVLQVAPPAERCGAEGVARDEFGVEERGQVGDDARDFLLVVEVQPEPGADVFECALRVFVVVEKGVPRLNLGEPGGLLVPLVPQFRERFDLLELPGVEVVQAVEVVVVLGAGDELFERPVAVLREREVLDEADVAGAGRRGEQHRARECGERHGHQPSRRASHRVALAWRVQASSTRRGRCVPRW